MESHQLGRWTKAEDDVKVSGHGRFNHQLDFGPQRCLSGIREEYKEQWLTHPVKTTKYLEIDGRCFHNSGMCLMPWVCLMASTWLLYGDGCSVARFNHSTAINNQREKLAQYFNNKGQGRD